MISTIFLTLLAAAPPQDPAPEAPAFTPATIAEGGAEVRAFHHVTMTEVAKLPAGTPVKIVAKREKVRDKKGRISIQVDKNAKLPMVYSRDFCNNMRALYSYIAAAQGGPAAKAEK